MRAALRSGISSLRLVEEGIVGELPVRFRARIGLQRVPLAALGLVHLVEREVEPGARLDDARVRVPRLGLALHEEVRGLDRRRGGMAGALLLLLRNPQRLLGGGHLALRLGCHLLRPRLELFRAGLPRAGALLLARLRLEMLRFQDELVGVVRHEASIHGSLRPVFWLAGGQIADLVPRAGALRIEGKFITGRTAAARVQGPVQDVRGLTLVPALIDAHVHLRVAGDPALVSRELLRRGVAAVLDLGSPERSLPLDHRPLRVRCAGPLFTAPGGYPTQTWGRDGYGLELASADQARAAVRRLAQLGARFIKLAFDPRHLLLDAQVAQAASDEAHQLGLKVAAHALELDSVRRALEAGADVLAHTPRDPLPSEVLERLRGKWVVSTLRPFHVEPERLAALREAGARIAYGTDLGNEGTSPAIDAGELALLERAGVDPLRAATQDAADLLGLDDLGRLSVGSAASLLAVSGLDPASLAQPVWVMNCGRVLA